MKWRVIDWIRLYLAVTYAFLIVILIASVLLVIVEGNGRSALIMTVCLAGTSAMAVYQMRKLNAEASKTVSRD